MKDVSVIIINYNTAKYTIDCIKSVLKFSNVKLSIDIVVVDNNSEPKDYEILEKNFPKQNNIKLFRSNVNTGFGGGNMLGAQFAKSKYLLFLNNDAMLKNDCISILYNYMKSRENVGVTTAQNYDENGVFVPSFDHNKGMTKLLFGRSFLEKINPKLYPKRKKEYTEPVNVNYVNGAFMFFRSDYFAQVGGFDNNIFLYFEEMDICHRLKKIGYVSTLVPEAKILHYQGVSTGVSVAISKEGLLSQLYVTKKNYSYLKYILIRIYYSVTFLFKPKKWFLLPLVLKGAHLSQSLKQKQKIRF